MPTTKPPYPAEFRQQIIELVQLAGKRQRELAREFGCTAQTIANWVGASRARSRQARCAGKDGLRAPSARSWRGCAARTASSSRSATSWQRLRPGSPAKATRRPHRLRTHEREPGQACPCSTMCRVLERLGQRLLRLAGARAHRSVRSKMPCSTERIRLLHAESDETYGMPQHSRRAARPGRARQPQARGAADARGGAARRQPPARLRRHHAARPRQRPAPDLVNREFAADGPNQLWVADMTYVPTWAGFIYLAVVLDVWSRRVVGWSIGETMTADLVLAALNMALQQRKPDGVIHHSDQGSQYTSIAFGKRCKEMGVRPRWARSATPTTTRWPRASSPASSAS